MASSSAVAAAMAARQVRANRQDIKAAPEPAALLQCGTCHLRFDVRADLKAHYKGELHRCNLQRKVEHLDPISLDQFENLQRELAAEPAAALMERQRRQEERLERQLEQSSRQQDGKHGLDAVSSKSPRLPTAATQCMLTRAELGSVEAVAKHLSHRFGFFIPDAENLCDLSGLLDQLRTQLLFKHQCWYCRRSFRSYEAAARHMTDKFHCKLPDEVMGTHPEISEFYSFESLVRNEMGEWENLESEPAPAPEVVDDFELVPPPPVGSGDVEDVHGDAAEDLEQAQGHFLFEDPHDVSRVPSLVLPDGRVLGHRSMARYYRQNHVQRGQGEGDGDVEPVSADLDCEGAPVDQDCTEMGRQVAKARSRGGEVQQKHETSGYDGPPDREARRAQRKEQRQRERELDKRGALISMNHARRHDWTQVANRFAN